MIHWNNGADFDERPFVVVLAIPAKKTLENVCFLSLFSKCVKKV